MSARSLIGGLAFVAAALCASPDVAGAEQKLTAIKIGEPVAVDGKAGESFWAKVRPVTVQDVAAKIPVTLKAAYDNENIYILASYPDETESRQHRTLKWNAERNVYLDGPEREDVLVLKWNMSPYPSGLTLKEDQPYRADEWFWKACRTDVSGHADDKQHVYSATPGPNTIMLVSKTGQVFYLDRPGDKGEPAYDTPLYAGYQGDRAPKFVSRTPTGSRADVRAKGEWQDKTWTVEFSRRLDTGNDDDLRLQPGKTAQFGVSRYEIAGRDPEPASDTPLYGCGDVGELITLSFE